MARSTVKFLKRHFHLFAALAIAAAKALLVILYFMRLRYTPGVTRLAATGGLLWLMPLVLGAMDDYVTRAWFPVPGK